jgi:hypothetical protein
MEGLEGSSLPSVTRARGILLVVDNGRPDGGLDVAFLELEGQIGGHLALNRPRDGEVALGGDVDVEALELRAHVDNVLEREDGALLAD